MYIYRVKRLVKVIDGDTFDVVVDLGFYINLTVRIRLFGIDTFEVFGKNAHPRGQEARLFTENWLTESLARKALIVQTFPLSESMPVADGSFGRWAGIVYDEETKEHLTEALYKEGLDKNT